MSVMRNEPPDPSAFPPGYRAVVFGASGGIGAALLAQLRAQGGVAQAMGLARTPASGVEITGVDVTDEATLAAAAACLAQDERPLRLVVVATGFLHDAEGGPEKSLRDLDSARLARAFAVNAIGPALVLKHFAPLLPREGRSVFVALSARVGSIGDNGLGGWHGYRASKAALNQLMRTASVELKRTRPGAIVASLHPGTVATPLSAPFAKAGLDVMTPDVAAARLLSVVERLETEDSGGFFDYRGEAIPW
jgi:NAD(P)-dependent dehydrogenase (short-subunit alcohol dehydrogenase family)